MTRPPSPPLAGARRRFLVACVAVAGLLAGSLHAEDGPLTQKVATDLVGAARQGTLERFVVVLAEQADVSAADALGSKREKTRYVFETLRTTAARTQPVLRAELKRQGYRVDPFYVANELLATAPAGKRVSTSSLAALAAREDVARLEPVRPAFLPGSWGAPETAEEAASAPLVNRNIESIGARALHDAGIRGRGIVVGIADSGADFRHPALRGSYRGRGTGHDYNWFDPSAQAQRVPTDTNGHGTHVTGVAVGRTSRRHIGVAPDATWISCRALGPGASRETVLRCLEWFLAPTDRRGRNPDPDRAPDVTNHSYICPFCSLETAFANLRAAGIFVAVANGNTGPSCGSVFDPGNYATVTTVGATLNTGGRDAPIADFSARGPSLVGGGVRPHLSMPGTDIYSALPDNRFGRLSGTSQATPHLVGAVALLWGARPHLYGNVTATRQVLFASAYPRPDLNDECPGAAPVPNNVFGHGFLDIERAVCGEAGCR